MTEKEMPKTYDEVIKTQRNCTMSTNDNRIIGEIFHEPEDNEDEKIKNAILNHLKKMWGNCQDDVCGVHVEDAIDWLESKLVSLTTNK